VLLLLVEFDQHFSISQAACITQDNEDLHE